MIEVATYSEVGGHRENEDAFEVRPIPSADGCFLCALADGQGGRAGGGTASRIACRASLDVASRYTLTELLHPATWIRVLQAADETVADDPAAGFTTLVAFCLTGNHICGASCGDSAAFLLRPDGIRKSLTERQHKDPPVGSRAAHPVSFAASLQVPWSVLAMTDGVWKYAGLPDILQIASEKALTDIIPTVRGRAGLKETGKLQDDFTLIVFEHHGK